MAGMTMSFLGTMICNVFSCFVVSKVNLIRKIRNSNNYLTVYINTKVLTSLFINQDYFLVEIATATDWKSS